MRIPVLTYHALRCGSRQYATDDHAALAADLDLIAELGARVIDLNAIGAYFAGGNKTPELDQRCVALTFDDGTNYDFVDFYHPAVGVYDSFHSIIVRSRLFAAHTGGAFATSFVIASPQARATLDQTCIAGRGQWSDHWWLPAAVSGVFNIANHSWDHLHPTLPHVAQREQKKGSFLDVDNWPDADAQIAAAQDFIEAKTDGKASRLFAYPYGHVNTFLPREYFPARADRFLAAFGTHGDCVREDSERWNLPRFVCGDHWKSPQELRALLEAAFEGAAD